ncbi:MAG: hypothetical protein R3E75_02665 [Steroidobacteraceae bacterium]|nr:hypothetical protein [Nevskiaceae bacterium]MCP5339039.1 hypothetical protein [Nevskiaceae bacterium]MCP5359549.1 hypothetical protein [Nevskiaceae bacterium]MCP5471946.1 hypothetical protein [Nevskiaceae bacterium]
MSATLALLCLHVGIWEGDYTHIDPADRSVQESYAFRIKVECPGDGPVAYRQTSRYRWDDGRTTELVYTGIMDGDRLVIDDGRIRGEVRAIEPQTLYMRFGFTADPSNQVTEMIQLSQDGQHRARTWHWLRNEQLWRITLVRERRTSRDPADW